MRPLVRLPLRQFIRHLHSPTVRPRRKSERTTLVLGVSVAVSGYVGWRIAGSDQHIALDALPKQPPQNATLSSARSRETEADTDLALSPNPPVQESHQVGDNRHSSGDKGTGHPSDSKPQAVTEDENTERNPKDSFDEDDEEGQGAFNPVTGEINWDCPCLGGMAHGPCGQQFREAFSCFVFSEQEPKGIDCIEKFKNMQDCFREHPDIYGEEIADDGEDGVSDPSSGSQTTAEEPSASVQHASSLQSHPPIDKTERAMSREKQ